LDGVAIYGGYQLSGGVYAVLLGVALYGGVASRGGELLPAYWRDSRAALFLGEVPTRHLLLGGVLILLGVYLAERAKSAAQKIGAVGN
jgi:drug/metabolite transporter (DMT)-like permease